MAAKLNQEQIGKIMDWLQHGYNPKQIEGLAHNQGWDVKADTVLKIYVPKAKAAAENRLKNSEKALTWFDKRFRAERAAEIAERLYGDIMEGKMFDVEETTMDVPEGIKTIRKPVYFAGLVKNWTDVVTTIRTELGQNKQTVDVNYNKNSNVNISVLIDKIYEDDRNVQKQLEGAEIIDIPSKTDFGDDKAYLAIVNEQTPEEVKQLTLDEDEDDEIDFLY